MIFPTCLGANQSELYFVDSRQTLGPPKKLIKQKKLSRAEAAAQAQADSVYKKPPASAAQIERDNQSKFLF
jgi:hypothetical protein